MYSRAVGLIRGGGQTVFKPLAYGNLRAASLAIDADVAMFKKHARTGKMELPKGKERLFRALNMDSSQSGVKPLEVFSPDAQRWQP